jgi:hypothetical protein
MKNNTFIIATFNTVMLSVVMLSVIMLRFSMLSVFLLNVIMLSVNMLNVVAPSKWSHTCKKAHDPNVLVVNSKASSGPIRKY